MKLSWDWDGDKRGQGQTVDCVDLLKLGVSDIVPPHEQGLVVGDILVYAGVKGVVGRMGLIELLEECFDLGVDLSI